VTYYSKYLKSNLNTEKNLTKSCGVVPKRRGSKIRQDTFKFKIANGGINTTFFYTIMNLDGVNGLDLNGVFKIANLAVAGLSVCHQDIGIHGCLVVLTHLGIVRIIPII
jgi:hypothetical protein